MSFAAALMPIAWICSRHGPMPGIPALASADTTSASGRSRRSVAVLIERKRVSRERSRIALSGVDAVAAQHRGHAAGGEIGVDQQARGIRQPEQLSEMQHRARALLAADH